MKIKMSKLRESFITRWMLVMTLFVVGVACENGDTEIKLPSIASSEIVTVPFFVQDESGQTPVSDNDLVFEVRLNNPVLDASGDQITWGEFNSVKGKVDVMCNPDGFTVELKLTGLIPNGVYTIWNVTFKDGGIDPTAEMMNIRGLGCLGVDDGTENHFIASAEGEGTISAFTPAPASLSMMGDIKACPIADEIEFHIVGAYHMDNKTWGPQLGPDGTAVEQFAFIFKNEM